MADNSSTFAASLLTMHDDLIDLATATERSRKHWKATGLSAEQKVTDLELTMRKSKIKYDSLADEYERARTGEGRGTGKVLNAFKNKSAAQVEEDLLRKVQAADQTYHGHVQTLQTEKSHLETSLRPEAIKALTDHIQEMDAGLTLQMQKLGKATSVSGVIRAALQFEYTNAVHSCFQREVAPQQWSLHQPDQGPRGRSYTHVEESPRRSLVC